MPPRHRQHRQLAGCVVLNKQHQLLVECLVGHLQQQQHLPLVHLVGVGCLGQLQQRQQAVCLARLGLLHLATVCLERQRHL